MNAPDNTSTNQDRAEDRDASLGVERADSAGQRLTDAVEAARLFSIEAARSLSDDKCEDVQVLDLRGMSQVTNFFVLASGTSERQMKSAGEHIRELGEERQFAMFRTNLREGSSSWFIIDFVDVIVHIFDPEQRAFYDLELLWGDAPRLEWSRPNDVRSSMANLEERNRAGLREDEVLPDAEGQDET